jgi:hypothetical protein
MEGYRRAIVERNSRLLGVVADLKYLRSVMLRIAEHAVTDDVVAEIRAYLERTA